MVDPFKTVYKGDFIWPYIAPLLLVPNQPPEHTKGNDDFKKEGVAKELCKCDRHSWSPHYQRAYHLKKKEQAFREAMIAVAQQRTILENEILHHPCTDSDDVLASLYQMNYSKRAFPVVGYRAMKADHDDPVINPVAMLRTGLTSGYRDPTEFRAQAMELTPVSKPPPLTFDRVPPSATYKPTIISEYKDSIDKAAISNIKASQQFREPMPSSRRRLGCL